MRCFYHQDVEAVAVCKSCSRGLCAACAADVGNGLACRDRCEKEVRALNEIIQRNKTAYAKARSAYARTALFYAVVSGLFLLGGLVDWRGFGWALIPAALIFAAAAFIHYSTGRKYD